MGNSDEVVGACSTGLAPLWRVEQVLRTGMNRLCQVLEGVGREGRGIADEETDREDDVIGLTEKIYCQRDGSRIL